MKETYFKFNTHMEKMSIFPQYLLTESFTTKKSLELFGHRTSSVLMHYKNKSVDIYFAKKDFNDFAQFLIDSLQDKKYFNSLKESIEQQNHILNSLISELELYYKETDVDKLFQVFNKYNTTLNTFRVYAALPNYMSMGDINIIRIYHNLINKDISNEDFSILTSSEEITESTLAERALLQIALEKEELWNKLLKNWVKKYGHIYYYYTGPLPNQNDAKKMLENLIATHKNIQQRINDINGYSKEIQEKIEHIEKKYELNENEKHLISVLRFFTLYKAQRKELMQKSYVALDPLLERIADKYKIRLDELKMFTYDELRNTNLLKKIDFLRKEAEQRKKESIIISENNTSVILSNSLKIEEFLSEVTVEKKKENNKKQGTVASVGETVRAQLVFINSKEDIKKIENIDDDFILGSFSTYPELLPAMAKSVGIITKIGGMTSHAAIVAREMKKPCIVGYSTIMDEFNEGDFIELNTKDGLIRKINK